MEGNVQKRGLFRNFNAREELTNAWPIFTLTNSLTVAV